ncbi:dipeptidase [Ahrensia sp. R2A130]|uniref:dipeptidase n=1 Tax=Ahrensia sp. R2A130 TaxID=744979 RepID=UPI0001E0C3AC|nr:membrane dipeptidase [Ahrensia sp. R2A130]EFL87607.1 dipeptidase AC [Ahrensia sp. R2A130]
MSDTTPLVFDGHNDILLQLHRDDRAGAVKSFLEGRSGALDLSRMKAGGFGGGFFALYVPSVGDMVLSIDDRIDAMCEPSFDLPLPPMLDQAEALVCCMEQTAILLDLERTGTLKICRTVSEIRTCMASGIIAAILHMEGAEAIDRDFASLEVLYTAGLRSIGPVWSRPTIYGEGVPFRYPSDGNIGSGLTEDGIRLVEHCNARGIMIDCAHLNEAGIRDVAKHSDAPIVATHSNVHAICASSRNLTDEQLGIIADSDGMVGLNFAVSFLREDGRKFADTPLDTLLKHLDHLIERIGEDRVGFGSDFDGALIPEEMGDVTGLVPLRKAMRNHGYDSALMEKLCNANWMRVLENTWK